MEFSIGLVLWIVGGLVGLIILGLLALYLDGKIRDWKWSRDFDRREKARYDSLSDEQRAWEAAERRRNMLAMQMNAGGTAQMMAVAELTATSDVAGLLSAFSLGDWPTRELVVTALGNICRDSNFDADEMNAALHSITALCKADSTGGTYRQNCIDHAQMLLDRTGN